MAVCCGPLISCFPCMLLRYCLNDSEMVPVGHIITGNTFSFTLHVRCIYIVRYYYYYYYVVVVSCHGLSSLVIFLNQRRSSLLKLQVSDCSTFRIKSDVLTTAVFVVNIISAALLCLPNFSLNLLLLLWWLQLLPVNYYYYYYYYYY
jgi:hypothetical protein